MFFTNCRDDINATWYMFDPHEIEQKYGKALEDTYGEEWEEFYNTLVADKNISKRTIQVKELVRLIIKSWAETGTPFVFNRDTVNKMNPNKHAGMIYSSNLCVTGDTQILTSNGYRKVIDLYNSQEDFDVIVDDRARTMNTDNKTVSVQKSTKMFKTKENAEIYKLKLSNGQELKATPYHKMYIYNDKNEVVKLELKDLNIGDKVLIQNYNRDIFKDEEYSLVKSIEVLEEKEDVYDVTVENGHSLIFNGIVTGNCSEICQNMSPAEVMEEKVTTKDGDTVIVKTDTPGDFVECNLASLTLGNLDVNNKEELENTINTIVRALDNVIDLNYYSTPYAEVTNKQYRAIGLGTSGYHHMLVKNGIRWSDREEHLEFADRVYEDINYYTIKASMNIAKEKGSYELFEGSDWQTGDYFDLRNYNSDRWQQLKKDVNKYGVRNSYLMAIAPTGSTSIISGTSAGVDPIMSRYFLEEKKGSIVPRVAPGLDNRTFWLYENAHNVDQNITVEATGVRQRHIDQSQSVNIYITTDYTMRQILNIYINAWENGVKSLYYVRGKSLEVEDCEVCSA